jgi:hypothetical protein
MESQQAIPTETKNKSPWPEEYQAQIYKFHLDAYPESDQG